MRINNRILITLLVSALFLAFFILVELIISESQNEMRIYLPHELVIENQDIKKTKEIVAVPRNNANHLNFRGVDYYPSPLPYDTGEAFGSLEHLLTLEEINYVQLRFFLNQDRIDSSFVSYDDKQDRDLVQMIRRIHRAGKKVSLLPHLILKEPDIYVANIKPKDKDLWFSSYQDSLMHYAFLAQENKVELFSVGNELYSVWQYKNEWLNIIGDVKETYKGLISVKLNCWWREISFHKVMSWDWLSELDYIGIAPYFDLTKDSNLSLEELRKAWQENRHGLNIASELEQIAKRYKRKVVFLEIGYRSIDGTSIEPWNADPVVPRSGGSGLFDPEEQSLATQALFDVFGDKDWWEGAFWFYWPTAKPLSEDKTWALWDKPVELVIRSNFR